MFGIVTFGRYYFGAGGLVVDVNSLVGSKVGGDDF